MRFDQFKYSLISHFTRQSQQHKEAKGPSHFANTTHRATFFTRSKSETTRPLIVPSGDHKLSGPAKFAAIVVKRSDCKSLPQCISTGVVPTNTKFVTYRQSFISVERFLIRRAHVAHEVVGVSSASFIRGHQGGGYGGEYGIEFMV